VATVRDTTPVRDLVQDVTTPLIRDGRRSRALDLLGKDRALLQAIADPKYAVVGLTNKALQQVLGDTSWAKGMMGKQLAARISRHLRLLRDHGLIRKLPKQRQYVLTEKGRKLTTALHTLLGATTEELLEKAA
jgi:DNA-binding transcriptional ArsR family regulator